MEAKKYDKVDVLPPGAMSISNYARMIGQKNPPYICVRYDRWINGKGAKPPYVIVNWQGFNFVILDK